MSFRGDDSRRYGHVPPAQYPVPNQAQQPYAGQQQQQQLQQQQQHQRQHSSADYGGRRPSFNNGDDTSFFDPTSTRAQSAYPGNGGRGTDELFMGGAPQAPAARQQYTPSTSSAIAGYQHSYALSGGPTHPAYNPQLFARSQSTSLPYHPHPSQSARYASPTSPTYSTSPAPPPPPASQAQNAYSPIQSYNPAAYASTTSPTGPQRHATVGGYGNYGYGGSYSSPAVPQVSTFQQIGTSSGYGSPQINQGSVSASQAPYNPSQHGYGSAQPSPGYPPTSSATSAGSAYGDPQYPSPSYPSQQQQQQHSQQYYQGGYQSNGSSSYSTPTGQASYSGYEQVAPSPPAHQQTTAGLQRHPTNAQLPRPPMDDVPEETGWVPNGQRLDDDLAKEHYTQDSLFNDIASDLGLPNTQRPRPAPINGNVTAADGDGLRRYDSNASTVAGAPGLDDARGINRYASTASTINRNAHQSPYEWEDDDSDPEAIAGLMAMQADAMDDRRFSSMPTFGYPDQLVPTPAAAPLPPPPEQQPGIGAESDFGGMDLGLYGGGYAGNLAYGDTDVPSPNQIADGSRPLPYPTGTGGDFPQYTDASMDYGGTGGLQEPQAHRMSFDEGDERVSIHSRQSGSESPLKEDYPDMFYHPGLSNRPLPAVPAAGSDSSSMLTVETPNRGVYQHGYSLSADSRVPLNESPETYQSQTMAQLQVERSISLTSHSNTPQVQAPARSITDAAEIRRKQMRHMNQQQPASGQAGSPYEGGGYDTGTPSSLATYDAITLPSGRRKKFIPSKLTASDMKRCAEPWALSGVAAWVREMAEGDPETKRKTIEEGLVKLFCHKVPTMNVADAEVLSTQIVDSMFSANILIPEEEWVKFGQGSISGVLWQLTGSGCYAPKLHEHEAQAPRLHDHGIPVRCYSYHCGRTLKKANLEHMMSEDDTKVLDWATFYHITKDEIAGKDKKEINKQNVLHEIVTGEEEYTSQLDIVRLLYRDQLRTWQPPIIPANRLEGFIAKVFPKIDELQRVNKEHLLAQLKYRQKEQGPWIVGFSDIFREWIRKARAVYTEYCTNYPYAQYMVRKEAERNLLFRQFLDVIREHKRSKRLEWTTFLKAPITRLQRYSLLLDAVLKTMVGESEEKANLIRALEEIRAVTAEIDSKVEQTENKVKMLHLQSKLVLRPGFQSVLNLDHLGRQLLHDGDLQRQGSKGVRWVDTHAILFDHYFILAKSVSTKDGRDKKYDVSKEVSSSSVK